MGFEAVGDNVPAKQAVMLSTMCGHGMLSINFVQKMMSFVKENKAKGGGVGYTYDDLRTLIELCYSAALRSVDREENIKAKKGMQDCLLQLGELLWDS